MTIPAPTHGHVSDELLAAGPYAGPRPIIAGGRATDAEGTAPVRARPYVPAEWRARLSVALPVAGSALTAEAEDRADVGQAAGVYDAATSDDLPWIDAFLSSTPPTGTAAVLSAIDTITGNPNLNVLLLDDIGVSADNVPEATVPEVTFGDGQPEAPLAASAQLTHEVPYDLSSEVMSGVTSELTSELTPEPMAVIMSTPNSDLIGVTSAVTSEPQPGTVDETTGEMAAAGTLDGEQESPVEAWPLEDAGAQMRGLADDLRIRDALGEDPDSSPLFDAPPHVAPLPMWGDDDMLDIMPVNRDTYSASPAPGEAVRGRDDAWADRARREQDGADSLADRDARENSQEAAAKTLEGLARRVREGELLIPGYDARLGDAAALAAALAALLGVRR